eukprot:CAMPEP_0168318704 /NCGR_PEP_ID=MMETSP0213-20121227/633_1 /TAXON_ID=151035 /ORGANISM="Euplotes harpa, Strain FSP1.4" /LENGTH=113 /DNA_ID=CAMNT_0008319813 /DNA_START=91 /DNA_END=429 /DNA_ORIENTATION=+
MSNVYLVMGGRDALFFVWASFLFSVIPLLFSILPESPRYLYANKDYEATKRSLNQIAKLNLQKDVDFSEVQLEVHCFSETNNEGENSSKCFGLLDLWRDKKTFRNTLILAFLW